MNLRSGFAILLLLSLPFVFSACGKRAETKIATSSDPRQIKDELIVSLQADLTTARKSATSPDQMETRRLAQALSLLLQEDGSPNTGISPWSADVLSLGSQKTAGLATAYLKARQSVQTDAVVEFDRSAEETIKRISGSLFDLKTARQVDAPLAEVSALIKQANDARATGPASAQLSLFHQLASTWKIFLGQKESGRNVEALQTLERLQHFTTGIQWIDAEKTSIGLREATESMSVPTTEQLAAAIQSLVEQAFSAKRPQDIDGPLAEIKKLRSFGDYLPERGEFRATAAQRLMENIQAALFARDIRDGKKLHEYLSRIESQESDGLAIPRSRFLLYSHQLRQSLTPDSKPLIPADSPAAAAARMASLETIKPNLPTLRLAVDSDPAIPFVSTWRMDLMLLETMATRAEQLKAGRGMQRAVHENGLGMTTVPPVAELQRQFDILCLDITFSQETGLPPVRGETTWAYTARIKERLARLEKWELLQTLFTATRALKIMEPVISSDDDGAVSGYLYGLRLQNEAKDLRMATCAFQSVLSSPSKLVPAALVGKQLEEIQKSDPRAYSQGSGLALNLSRSEGKRAPGERAPALVWLIPARKPATPP